MPLCDDLITSVLGQITLDWSCTSLDHERLLVTSPHQYSDGDHVEILVQRVDGVLLVSDGGEAMARLDVAGVNLESGRAHDMLRRLVRAHELELREGRLSIQGPLTEAGRLLESMANALVNVDGLRLLALPPPKPRFAQLLVTFLQAEFEFVDDQPQLHGRSGGVYRATAAAGRPEEPVYVQAVSGSNPKTRQRAIEHAFTMFSDVNGSLPGERKLIVLGDAKWRQEQMQLLSTVAYVGSWKSREQLVEFIGHHEETNFPRLLVHDGEQATLGD